MNERYGVALLALGCRVNRSDLDALASALTPPFAPVTGSEAADYVIVNTCTVTADADSAARQAIRRAARLHPGAAIIVSGCYAQVHPEELRELPGVVAVTGARSVEAVRRALERAHAQRSGLAPPAQGEGWKIGEEEEVIRGFGPPPRPFGHTRAFLKIQDGCDAACAYCAIPAARGRSRSLPFGEALARIEALARQSPEVVLAGVHLGAYGRDRLPRTSLLELIAAAAERGIARRLRLSSIEPLELPIEIFRGPSRPIVCEHAHLPLQSGAARVLAAMRRPYTPGEFERVVDALVTASPGICIGADVMTGFPGESEAEHRATLEFLGRLPLAYLHVFPFSARPGTDASRMPSQVDVACRRERARALTELGAQRWGAYMWAQRGRELEVVVERTKGGFTSGTARNYVTVRWPSRGERRGDLVRVRVEGVEGETCQGRPLGASPRG